MLCNPFHQSSSARGVTVSVFARLCRCFCPVVFVKLFFKHYQNWEPSAIEPKQHISEPHISSHIDTDHYSLFSKCQ